MSTLNLCKLYINDISGKLEEKKALGRDNEYSRATCEATSENINRGRHGMEKTVQGILVTTEKLRLWRYELTIGDGVR